MMTLNEKELAVSAIALFLLNEKYKSEEEYREKLEKINYNLFPVFNKFSDEIYYAINIFYQMCFDIAFPDLKDKEVDFIINLNNYQNEEIKFLMVLNEAILPHLKNEKMKKLLEQFHISFDGTNLINEEVERSFIEHANETSYQSVESV